MKYHALFSISWEPFAHMKYALFSSKDKSEKKMSAAILLGSLNINITRSEHRKLVI